MSLPAWVKANNTFEKLMNLLTDVYSSASFPPPVAYLKGGKATPVVVGAKLIKNVAEKLRFTSEIFPGPGLSSV